MNNKGFTLIEVLMTLTIVALIMIIVLTNIGSTLSLSNEKAYELTKSNIINATKKYMLECDNNLIECNIKRNKNKTEITAKNLIKAGYFKELVNPINNHDLSNCLIIEIDKNNNYKINDKKCK